MKLLRIASIATLIAGFSHLTLQAYSHLGMPFYLGSFVFIGVIQIVLAAWLWKGKISQKLFWPATLVNGVAIVFWLLTRVVSAPFIGGVEHFSIIGISVIALQIISIACICLEGKKIRNFILVLLGSLGIGFASHFGAMQLEQYFPELKGTGGHHGGDNNSAMSAEDHSKMMNNYKEKKEEASDSVKSSSSLIEASIETEVEFQIEDNHSDDSHTH